MFWHPLTAYFWMNSYHAEILFCFRIITSSSTDFAYLASFYKPTTRNNQTNKLQPTNKQPPTNETMFKRSNEQRQKITEKIIFDQLQKKTDLPPKLCATFFAVVRLLIPEIALMTTFSSRKSDCNLGQYKKRNAQKILLVFSGHVQICADISLTGANP